MTSPQDLQHCDDDGLIALLPDLRIEVSHHEDMVILEQGSSTGDASRVAIHKWQVQMLADEMGLSLASAAPVRRDVAAILARRLRKLHERIDELGKYLYEHCEDEYAQQHAWATCEIGDEYLADLDELLGARPAQAQAPRLAPGPRPAGSVRTELHPTLRRSLGVAVLPGEDPEQAAGQAFRDFLQQNKPLLMLVAHWGDDRCGWLHRVLMEELIGAPRVPPRANDSRKDGQSAQAPNAQRDGAERAATGQLELGATA